MPRNCDASAKTRPRLLRTRLSGPELEFWEFSLRLEVDRGRSVDRSSLRWPWAGQINSRRIHNPAQTRPIEKAICELEPDRSNEGRMNILETLPGEQQTLLIPMNSGRADRILTSGAELQREL